MTENHLTTRFSCSSASSRSLSMRILSRVGTASRCLVDYWAKTDSFDLKAKVVVPPQHSRDRMLMTAGNWKPRVAKRFEASSLRGVIRKDQVCFCQGVEFMLRLHSQVPNDFKVVANCLVSTISHTAWDASWYGPWHMAQSLVSFNFHFHERFTIICIFTVERNDVGEIDMR